MTIGQLRKQVAFFLGKTASSLVDEDGNDMIIAAFNHVRKDAERNVWFNNAQIEAWLSVSAGSEASLGDAKLISAAGAFTTTAVNVKAVDTLYLGDDVNLSSYLPIWHDSKRLRSIKNRERGTWTGNTGMIERYPGDYAPPSSINGYNVYFHGSKFAFNPPFSSTKKLAMDAYMWLDDYVENRLLVATSSTASTAVTLVVAAPLNVVINKTTLLGQTVTAIATNRLSLTLGGNANATVTTNTYKAYTNPTDSIPGNGGLDYEDWFVEHGGDYLLWGAICHLNLNTNTFAPQTAGFNVPPERARDAALAKLITWDALFLTQGRYSFRNR